MITQYGTQPQKELFVLLRLPMKKTISVATKVALPMELDPAVLKVSTNIAISSYYTIFTTDYANVAG